MKSNETLEKKINEAALRVSPAVSVSVPQKWMAPLAEENKCKRERGRRGATVPEHEEVLFFSLLLFSFSTTKKEASEASPGRRYLPTIDRSPPLAVRSEQEEVLRWKKKKKKENENDEKKKKRIPMKRTEDWRRLYERSPKMKRVFFFHFSRFIYYRVFFYWDRKKLLEFKHFKRTRKLCSTSR